MIRELSIFIDESGDFGKFSHHSPYYIIGIILHEQNNDISEPIRYLNQSLNFLGFKNNFVHIGPLIRNEYDYKNFTPIDRVRILRKMMAFVSQIDFTYKTIVIEKKQMKNGIELYEKLSGELSKFIERNQPYFYSFDKIIAYYDNGQEEIVKIIVSVFSTLFHNVEFRKANQKDYKLLQVADLICSATLIGLKMSTKNISRSERRILGSDRDIKKFLLKPLKLKEFPE